MARRASKDPLKEDSDPGQASPKDTYPNFSALEAAEREGEAWVRESEDRGSRVLVLAPHGGWIEPMTTELARAVAGQDFSFYSFIAVKDRGNERLHLTSHRFDDPVALAAAARADMVLAIHGERSSEEAFVMVGGGGHALRGALEKSLRQAGFPLREPRDGLGGRHKKNICNRGAMGGGGQLELSEGLRRQFRRDPEQAARFVDAVRSVILLFETA